LQDHLTGKQYLGWKKIRETYAEIMKARDERMRGGPIEAEPRHRSSSRDYRDRERERESGREREREREPDRERPRERGSSRDYRSSRDERDYRGSGSRDRDYYDRWALLCYADDAPCWLRDSAWGVLWKYIVAAGLGEGSVSMLDSVLTSSRMAVGPPCM
jgi:hypothetical protein